MPGNIGFRKEKKLSNDIVTAFVLGLTKICMAENTGNSV